MGSNINFIADDPMEIVLKVAGQNLLLLHGMVQSRHGMNLLSIKSREDTQVGE